jgi:hypothetical protein
MSKTLVVEGHLLQEMVSLLITLYPFHLTLSLSMSNQADITLGFMS